MPILNGSKPKVRRRLLSDEVHDHLRDAILDGTFSPGESLDDTALQEWLGVSRTPIRDALKRLQYEGLVEIYAQSSTRVADPDLTQVEKGVQAFGAIMGGVTRIALPELSDSEREGLLILVDATRTAAASRNGGEHLDATLAVYESLLASCSNDVLVGIAHNSLMPLAFGYRASLGVRTPNWALLDAGWARFRDGIATGDNVLAELALEEMHRLPLPDLQWDPAVWDQKRG